MNLAEVKSALGVANLELNKSTNADGTVNPEWFRMWNNETRVQVSIHRDVVNAIQANPSLSNLGIQSEDKISPTSNLPYTNKRIIAYTEAEITL